MQLIEAGYPVSLGNEEEKRRGLVRMKAID